MISLRCSLSTTLSKAFRVQRISRFHYTPLIIESKPKRNTAIRSNEDAPRLLMKVMHSLYGSLQQCTGLLKMNSGLGQNSRKHQLKIEHPVE